MNRAEHGQELGPLTWQSSPENWLGPYFLAVAIEATFLGILCNQVWIYYTGFPKDPSWIKQTVGLVFIFSILKTVQSIFAAWFKIVAGFPSWQRAAYPGWAVCAGPILTCMVSSAAQVFFIWRCYSLTGRNRILLAIIVGVLLTQFAMSAAATFQLNVNQYDAHAIKRWMTPWHASAVVLDFVITSIVSYKLIKSRKGDNINTDTILTKILMVTWESALPPAIAEVIGLVVHSYTVDSRPMWNYMTHAISPRLYAFSLMYCLNSRIAIRKLSLGMGATDQREKAPGRTTVFSEVKFRRYRSGSMMFPSFDQSHHIPPAGLCDAEEQRPCPQCDQCPLERMSSTVPTWK